MNCYNMVLEYINKSEKGIPIFIEEIKDYIIKFYNEKDKEKVLKQIIIDVLTNKNSIFNNKKQYTKISNIWNNIVFTVSNCKWFHVGTMR